MTPKVKEVCWGCCAKGGVSGLLPHSWEAGGGLLTGLVFLLSGPIPTGLVHRCSSGACASRWGPPSPPGTLWPVVRAGATHPSPAHGPRAPTAYWEWGAAQPQAGTHTAWGPEQRSPPMSCSLPSGTGLAILGPTQGCPSPLTGTAWPARGLPGMLHPQLSRPGLGLCPQTRDPLPLGCSLAQVGLRPCWLDAWWALPRP